MFDKVDILGVEVDAIAPQDVWPRVRAWVDSGDTEYVCVRDVHGVTESLRDPELMRIHRESGLTVPDGMPLVWCGRFAGAQGIDRVYGPKMMIDVCEAASRHGLKSFLYGGGDGVVELLSRRLRERIPDLEIAGCHTPPFRPLTEEEKEKVVQEIEDSGAELVWVGLSTPKQERWMAEFQERLSGPRVLFGVGAAFDINAGLVKDAPAWIGRFGLQWLFRLGMEPRRLWRRYLRANPRFMLEILRRPPRVITQARVNSKVGS